MTQTPIFDTIVDEQEWSPDKLGAKLDLDAMIAASYGIERRQAHATRARKRKRRQQQQRQQQAQ